MHQNILEKVIKSFLDDNIHELPTVAVSGGIDSLTLAVFISKLFNEKKINIAHAIGPAVPIEATKRVKKLAKEFNWNLNIINTNEINDPRYRANPINRCFFCKENLYSTIKSYTKGIIFSGANLDDLNDYRPGLDAAKEANVMHPFILAKIEKKIVEIWSTHPSNDRKGHRLTSLMAQGSFLLAKKELYKAHEIFSQIILADSNWAEAWNKRATVLYFLGRYEESQNDINKVLQLERRHFGALSGQGLVQNELRNFEKALKSYEEVQKIYPSMEAPKVMIPLLKKLVKGLDA